MAVTQSFRTLLCLLVLAVAVQAQDVLLTLPFENVSGRAEYNWVGESFVVLYGELLETPHLKVLDADERNLIYERLGLRASDLLTRAAVMRVAETAQANLALVGTYDIGGEGANTTIAISARLIEVSTGRLAGNKVFTRSGLLSDLQEMQGELAWNVLNERNRAATMTREQLIAAAKGIPPRAYESFVKGIQTQDAKMRELLLRRALQEAGNSPYPQALYELGLHFYRQRAYVDAVEQFRQVKNNGPRYNESQFYLGLAAHALGHTQEAATAFDQLVEPVPLTEVFNNAGALWFLKGEQARGLTLLRRAVAQSPADATYRFNYGYALWKVGNHAEAAQMLKVAAEQNPRDGEAWFLWAKSLEASGNTVEASKVDDQAKRSFPNYARWAVAPDKIPAPFRLKPEFNRAQFYRLQPGTCANRHAACQCNPGVIHTRSGEQSQR
jgi:tetratricopeptide (TPR) repeat protein